MSGMTSLPGGDVVQRTSASAFERAITSQPDIISDAITTNLDKLRAAMAIVAGARRVRLTGSGASFHAAEVGEHLLRTIGVNATATNAFDLATYPTGFEPGDAVIVISHSGITRYARQALTRAGQSGLKTIVITSEGSPLVDGDVVIETMAREDSNTASASTACAMAVVAAIAARFEPHSDLASAVPTIPESVRSMLPSRQTALQVAEIAAQTNRRTLVAGAGGLAPIARLGALTARVTSYQAVEGMHIEEAIYGGLQALQPEDLVIHLAGQGAAEDRHADLAHLTEAIGFKRWKIGGKPDRATWHTGLPQVPGVVSPILSVVPLQWLALELARFRGTNPDSFRRDDPAFDRAFAQIEP